MCIPPSSTAVRFCQILLTSKPEVRAIEVPHAACKKMSFDKILDLTAVVF